MPLPTDSNQPLVFIIVATTLDGFIAQATDQLSTDWTSKGEIQNFTKLSKQAGVVVMGETSFATIKPKYRPLKDRLNIVYSHQTKEELIDQWQLDPKKTGDDSFRVTSLPPAELVAQLQAEGHQQIAISGGRSIYTQFMKSGVVDKLFLTVEPIIFGDGLKFLGEPIMQRLQLVDVERLNEEGSLVLEYDCLK